MVERITEQRLIKVEALATVDKKIVNEPTESWLKKMYLSEHSPIRAEMFRVVMTVPSWVSVHFVRHKIGVEHWVSTQRDDRKTYTMSRAKMPQDTPVKHEMLLNAQAFIFISRRRLCTCASKETRIAWRRVLNELKEVAPVLESVCVPECVYRGFCPEITKCGYIKTKGYLKRLEAYRA